MRTRRPSQDQVAEVARRRLELLSAELAELRSPPPTAADHARDDGSPGGPHADAGGTAQPAVTGSAGPDLMAGPGAPPGRHAHRSVGFAGSTSGWLSDRLPPSLQGRVRMSGAHLLVVALVAIGAVALTVGWVARAQGSATAVPAAGDPTATGVAASGEHGSGALVTPAAPGAAAGSGQAGTAGAADGTAGGTGALAGAVPTGSAAAGTAATGGAAAGGSIVVDVTGKVRRPGIATLPPGSRVVDALEAAGGARPGTRLGSLNLARPLTDGEQVVVGVPAVPGIAASAASVPSAGARGAPGGPGALVNLNTASVTELEVLPGVGPVTAQAIVDFRTENGGFTSVDELLEVSGIGDATLAEIAPHATI